MLSVVFDCTMGQGQVGHTGSAQSQARCKGKQLRSSAKTRDPEIYPRTKPGGFLGKLAVETLAPFEAWLGAHLWAYSQRPVLTRVVPPKRGRRGEGLTRRWGKTEGKGTVRGHFAPSFLSFWLLCKLAEVGQKLAPARSHGMAFGAMAGGSGSLPAAIASTPGPSPTVSSAVACPA